MEERSAWLTALVPMKPDGKLMRAYAYSTRPHTDCPSQVKRQGKNHCGAENLYSGLAYFSELKRPVFLPS